jgi:hypothetical protein
MPGMSAVLASLQEFCGKVVRRWYAFGVGVIGGILGVVSAVYGDIQKPPPKPAPPPPPLIPLWFWLTLLTAGFLVAIVWAFHDVRMERDTALAEIERRFGTVRYAFTFGGAGAHVRKHADGDTWDVEVWVTFTSSSVEPVRYTLEELTAIIDGQRSEEDDSVYQHTAVVPPHGEANALCPPVRNVSMPWQDASVEFTIRYGHPEGQLRHRKSQTYILMIQRNLGLPDEVLGLSALLLRNPEVEDVNSDQPSRGIGRAV